LTTTLRAERGHAVRPLQDDCLGLEQDPVLGLLLSGAAQTAYEAEEMYLDACLPEVLRLLQGPLSDEELGQHPLMALLRAHGSRGWEDSLL
jgi:hypothetical protein